MQIIKNCYWLARNKTVNGAVLHDDWTKGREEVWSLEKELDKDAFGLIIQNVSKAVANF
jgi:hypothetical protein